MGTKTGTFRQIEITAEVQNVTGEGYSWDADTVAKVNTTVRLTGRFDRSQVASLVTSIVNQLVAAFDEGEGPQDVDPSQFDGGLRTIPVSEIESEMARDTDPV